LVIILKRCAKFTKQPDWSIEPSGWRKYDELKRRKSLRLVSQNLRQASRL